MTRQIVIKPAAGQIQKYLRHEHTNINLSDIGPNRARKALVRLESIPNIGACWIKGRSQLVVAGRGYDETKIPQQADVRRFAEDKTVEGINIEVNSHPNGQGYSLNISPVYQEGA